MVLHLRAQGLEEGDEQPAMLSNGAWLTLRLPYPLSAFNHIGHHGNRNRIHVVVCFG